MKIIIDGSGLVMGRLASYVAKQALEGREVVVLNCQDIIITGKAESLKIEYEIKRNKMGVTGIGPKYPKKSEKVVKKAIQRMMPNTREGRGKVALKRVLCYNGTPEEYKNAPKTELKQQKRNKFVKVSEISR